MDELTYRFTREQLRAALNGAIEMFLEYRDKHSYAEDRALPMAVGEILDGLDADRELVATDGHERLRLQLPPIVAQADASAESYEANSKALSS